MLVLYALIKRPVFETLKSLEVSRKSVGKIKSKSQLKYILANVNRGETTEINLKLSS